MAGLAASTPEVITIGLDISTAINRSFSGVGEANEQLGGVPIMPIEINRDEVRRLVADGAQLVDVLPAKQYEEEHLPGAINITLRKLDRQTTAQLDRNR